MTKISIHNSDPDNKRNNKLNQSKKITQRMNKKGLESKREQGSDRKIGQENKTRTKHRQD